MKMDNLLDWLAKFFGHIPVAGIEALLFKCLQAVLVLLVVFVVLRILFKAIDHDYRIDGKQHYLWRAVDQDGEVVDVYLQKRRDGVAAKRFFKRLLFLRSDELEKP